MLRELEKIKRERAAEKAKQVRVIPLFFFLPSQSTSWIQEAELSASDALAREYEIATANPLLNLQAALGQASTPATGGFTVKRRWDDGSFPAHTCVMIN